MGKRLKENKVRPDLMISSPAKRAVQTAELIAQEIGMPAEAVVTEESVYAGNVSDMIKLIQSIDDSYCQVMLFGHNPDVTMLVEYCAGYEVKSIPTCGVVCLEFDIASWKQAAAGTATIKSFDYPQKDLCH